MNKIDISQWKPFAIEKLFMVVKGTRLTKANMRDGEIRFIGASAINNGVTAQIANKEKLHPANTITITYNGSVGEAFYQDEEFWASDDVNVLYPKFEMNQYTALFIIPLLKSAGKKYAFIDKWKKETMEKDSIMLPVDKTGNPDFAYMESYMRNLESTVSSSLTVLRSAKNSKICNLANTPKWNVFTIGQIFPKIVKPQVYHTREVKQEDNGIPYVVRSKFNNGIKYLVAKPNGTINPAKVISFGAENATFFYQEKEWISGRDMYYIDTTQIDKYACLFITACLQPIAVKYTYNFGLFPDLLRTEKIKLPVDKNGNVDYSYMSAYMKAVETSSETKVKQLNFA